MMRLYSMLTVGRKCRVGVGNQESSHNGASKSEGSGNREQAREAKGSGAGRRLGSRVQAAQRSQQHNHLPRPRPRPPTPSTAFFMRLCGGWGEEAGLGKSLAKDQRFSSTV